MTTIIRCIRDKYVPGGIHCRKDYRGACAIRIRWAIVIHAWIVIIVVSGCGESDPNRGSISGIVTLDGEVMEKGSIEFLPIDDTQGVATGGQIEQGRYRLKDKSSPVVG